MKKQSGPGDEHTSLVQVRLITYVCANVRACVRGVVCVCVGGVYLPLMQERCVEVRHDAIVVRDLRSNAVESKSHGSNAVESKSHVWSRVPDWLSTDCPSVHISVSVSLTLCHKHTLFLTVCVCACVCVCVCVCVFVFMCVCVWWG